MLRLLCTTSTTNITFRARRLWTTCSREDIMWVWKYVVVWIWVCVLHKCVFLRLCMCVYLCVYLHVPVPLCSTASVQCTMVVCEETTPGKLPLDHAVAGAKVPLNTLYYGRLQLHHVFVGVQVQVPLSTLYYTIRTATTTSCGHRP